MQNFTSSDARFVFEGNINRVYQDMLKRLKPHGSREGTDTGPESDGKAILVPRYIRGKPRHLI